MEQIVIRPDKLEEIELLAHEITDGDQILLGVFNLLVGPESLGEKELELYNKFLDAVHDNEDRMLRIKRIVRELIEKRNSGGNHT